MKRFSLLLLAVSSLVFASHAETRPRYGGTLRIALSEAPQSPDPAALTGPSLSNLSRQIFETLVALDERGRPQPLLATSWQSEPGNQRWRFLLRSGVSFHDGTPLDAAAVVASLRNSNPSWRVVAAGNTVIIETNTADPELLSELALPRNGIVHRGGPQLNGTGPFVNKWDPGKQLTLTANDQYWGGRPFLDSVEVDFGINDRDSSVALDLGKADVIELAPENIERARAQGRKTADSDPSVLLALVFANDPRSEMDLRLRTVLAQSLDTAAMNDVVLQGSGLPAASLLPNWLSGYAFVFNSSRSTERAQRTEAYVPALTLTYDPADPIERVIAERILLNSRDAGLTIQLTTSTTADLRLVREPMSSADPRLALMEMANNLQLPAQKLTSDSLEDLYAAEKSLLQSGRIIPLLHVRYSVAMRPSVRGWRMFPDGTWSLSNVWLAPEQP